MLLLKQCAQQGTLNLYPLDASVFLDIFSKASESFSVKDLPCPYSSKVYFKDFALRFERDLNIHPLIRIWHSSISKDDKKIEVLQGYACSTFLDGVGRLFLVPSIQQEAKLAEKQTLDGLLALCTPCECRAGHLLLVRLRVYDFLECECSSSLLKTITKSFELSGKCPFTFRESLSQQLRQQIAIAITDQRYRIIQGFSKDFPRSKS